MSDVRIVDHSDRLIAKIRGEMERRIGVASRTLAADIANKFGETGEPSKPGEYPKRQTGELVESITVIRGELQADIGPTADHAGPLAASGRKTAIDVYQENREAYQRLLLEGR